MTQIITGLYILKATKQIVEVSKVDKHVTYQYLGADLLPIARARSSHCSVDKFTKQFEPLWEAEG
jgi:hypothetical protein